jgi:hypothetical protein
VKVPVPFTGVKIGAVKIKFSLRKTNFCFELLELLGNSTCTIPAFSAGFSFLGISPKEKRKGFETDQVKSNRIFAALVLFFVRK